MKFCDMPYERIDVKAATEALDAAAERLSAAKTLGEAEKAFRSVKNNLPCSDDEHDSLYPPHRQHPR